MTTVYLAGPINGCTDDEANGWRQGFMESLAGCKFLDPMVRDYRGREDECVSEIVEGDKADIDNCNVFLAYCWQVSWGTAMEIYYAWNRFDNRGHSYPKNKKQVILVVPAGQRISPWLRHHSDLIVPTLTDARRAILDYVEEHG